MPTPLTSHQVAVIGAGAAGIVAARELRREGYNVVVFERDAQIGGTWVYDPLVEPNTLCIEPSRAEPTRNPLEPLQLPPHQPSKRSHGFRESPFTSKNDKTRDPRRYPGHREVLLYLQDYAKEFGIEEMVRFETEVVAVGLVQGSKKWKVRCKTRKSSDLDCKGEIYDAVVVCNGHFTEPRIADMPGIGSWPGKQVHSHNYRVPEPFQDKVVILIGSRSSAVVISREIAGVAKEVHVTTRSVANETYEKQPGYDNMWLHSMIESVHEDGHVIFRNGSVVLADIILPCTGYKYHFPFLDINGIVTVNDNRVGPLYKHVFPPSLVPWLSFVGLPWKVVPFRISEFQSKWIAGVLSGKVALPSQEEMMEDIEAFYLSVEASNIPNRYTHNLCDSLFEYSNWLAAQCGCEEFEEWKKQNVFGK